MELRAGYKQTEVGVIPDEWDVKLLDDVFRFLPTGNNTRSELAESGDVKYLHYGDIHTKLRLFLDCRSDAIPYIDAKKVANLPSLEDGDVIIADASEDYTGIGAAIEVKNAKSNRVVAGLHTLLLRGDKNILLDGFKTYLFSLKSVHDELIRVATGVSVYGITKNNIKDIPIPIPPLPEQQAIAAALSDVDALIAALDALIAKKRNIKQGAMQELLTGKKRLAGFGEEWEIVRFEDIADKNVPWSITGGPFGSNLKASDYVSEGVRVIQLQNIGDGKFNDESQVYVTTAKANELISCNIYPGEIILSKMGDPVARACFIPEFDERYVLCSDGIRLAVDKDRFDKRFVFAYINFKYFRNSAIQAITGSTRQRIAIGDLRTLPFVAPSRTEQHAIAEILSDMDAEIEGLERKRTKYQAVKQGMMQELLTGKTRLVGAGL